MAISLFIKNQHLLWRSGFGIDAKNINLLSSTKPNVIVKNLFGNLTTEPQYIDVASASLKDTLAQLKSAANMQDMAQNGFDKIDKETRKKLREQSQEDIKNLNIKWLDEMVNSNNPLLEKMSLFWHGHFACREINIFFQQKLLHSIRSNALGNFGDLLKAVSKSASMISFLNNQQNKKKHPNENFAREVMELFTLGRGNYSEQDIKEAARAFTGWSFNIEGDFVFRALLHDDGSKTFLGQIGYFNGDDILDILLKQKQTAKYITTKIYKYFVNENVDEKIVESLATKFYNSNYNIATLMQEIFSANWFYEGKNIAAKIKSPIELIVGIRKLLPMQMDKPEIQLLFQKALGQLLFYPPNVAGWAGGKNWIDSSSLMVRLQLPRLIKDNENFNITTKTDDDQQMGMRELIYKKMQEQIGGKYKISATVNWQEYIDVFANVKREELLSNIESVVLINSNNRLGKTIESSVDSSSREAFIKSVTINLMSTPEYQMC